MNTKRISLGMSPDLAKKLSLAAKKDGRTRASLIRLILKQWTEAHA